MNKFRESLEKNIERLEEYVPVVERVHGGTHPEFYDVSRVFDRMNGKIKEAGENKPELDGEFKELREITDNYKIPQDTCETYEAVYEMIEEIDRAYRS